MQFFKALSFAALAVVAAAQTGGLQFTSFPPETVQSGSGKYSLNYKTDAGKINTPVTISLRKGSSGNLATIGKPLTTTAVGGVFVFQVPAGLASGSDYALSISQEGSDPNYTKQFTVQGSTSSSASSTSASSSTAAPYSAGNSTTVAPTGTGASGSILPTMSRNQTFSSATLSPSSTGGSGSGTGSSASAASSSVSTGAASRLDSQFALVFGIVGAFAYLN